MPAHQTIMQNKVTVRQLLNEIVDLTMNATTRAIETGIPRVLMVKGDVPEHQLSAVYEPMIGFTVQGTKTLYIGSRTLTLKGPSCLVLPMHVPVRGRVRPSREGLPYLSVGLSLDSRVLFNLLNDLPKDMVKRSSQNRIASEASPEFIESWVRMLRLLKTPEDIPALAPVYEREILYRVLMGPHGWYLRQAGFRGSNASKISITVTWLRQHYTKPMDIGDLASKAVMGVTTFHRQFKRTTGLSPIQFQKQLRLLEARNLLVYQGYAVASAAYEVGYQSASQFNREYSRFFGASPARDAADVRQIENARSD
jgi:AraC-like DNA-binding protein